MRICPMPRLDCGKGPACQMTYLLGDMKVKWQKRSEPSLKMRASAQVGQRVEIREPMPWAN